MSQPLIIPTAEPFFFPGSSTGCLLVHGFTGAPKEMRWLGEYLRDQGHSVLGVRLFGHATRAEDMERSHWQDWLASVEDGWHLLRSSGCERIFVLGLSLGGMLSLTFASRFPVSGVVAMSAPHHLPADPRLKFVRFLSIFQPRLAKGPPDWFDQAALAEHISYASDPTRSIGELNDLVKVLQDALPQVNAPALLIYSRQDQTVRPEDGHAEKILAALGSQDKEIVWVENSGHVVTRDAARQQVFQAAGDFIHHCLGA